MYEPYLFRKAVCEVRSYDPVWNQLGTNIIKDKMIKLLHNVLTDDTRKLIIKIFMRNKFTLKYLLRLFRN